MASRSVAVASSQTSRSHWMMRLMLSTAHQAVRLPRPMRSPSSVMSCELGCVLRHEREARAAVMASHSLAVASSQTSQTQWLLRFMLSTPHQAARLRHTMRSSSCVMSCALGCVLALEREADAAFSEQRRSSQATAALTQGHAVQATQTAPGATAAFVAHRTAGARGHRRGAFVLR